MTEPPEPPSEPAREPGHPGPARPEPAHPEPMPPPAEPYGPGPRPAEPYGGEPATRPYGTADEPAGYGAVFEYGGRWRRLIAAIVDGLIVYAVTWLLTAPILGFGTMYEGSLARQTFANIVAGVVAFLYSVLQHGRWGQTVGKRVMSLRVVRAEDAGAIGYGQAAWRLLFAYLISLVTCGVGGLVDVAWILWDPRRQALHDKVARTVVVRAEPGMPDPYAG
jgi:uncharacterized RDD family membrane protein YckC